MASSEGRDKSLTDIFGDLQLSDAEDSLTWVQLEDPCNMPQSDPNGNCDDGNSSSSVILVDSNDSSAVSFIHPADLRSDYLSTSEDNNNVPTITIEETDDNGPGSTTDSATSGADMDTSNSSRSGLKRFSPYILSDDEDSHSKKCKLDAISGAGMEASGTSSSSGLKRTSPFPTGSKIPNKKFMGEMTATSSSPKVVTRSGRAVRVRLDKKFDYSSSQPEEDDEQVSEDLSLNSDDEEFQLNGGGEEPTWSSRKRRRSSHGSYRTGSSSGCDASIYSHLEAKIIYLDLGPPVATINYDPLADLNLEDDADLRTKIHKFLGLIPRRRKLYNPEDYLDQDPPDESSYKAETSSRSFLQMTSPPTTEEPKPPPPPPPAPAPPRLNASHLKKLTREERQAKMLDDNMLMVNANTLEAQTPDFIKAPIDLTDLPSEKWRANICRRHKSCLACLEQHPLVYRFVDSLNPETSIKMCHPQALTYRKNDFESCKYALAKLLFNIFNHAIFKCALQPDIEWKRSMGTPCRCEMTVAPGGQRSARILLWENIKQPGMLVKPLLHEMCHAAAFVFNRETGHGDNCRRWAYQANHLLMELPLVNICDARFRYVCSLCGRGSYGLMQFITGKELLRCHYCQFEVVVEPWSKDDLYNGIRPDTTMTEFKTFICDRYQQLGEEEGGSTHSSKMRALNQQYLALKIQAACDES